MEKKEKNNSIKIKIAFLIIIIILIASISINIFLYNNKEKNIIRNDENIVFLGDSITEQYDVKKFYPNNNVINSGIGGNKTEDIINRMQTDVYDYNPSQVFLLVGINDLASCIAEDDYLFNLQTIIKGIKENRKYAKIYVESIYPLTFEKVESINENRCMDIDNNKIKKINKKIEKICLENKITYVDVYNNLVSENGELTKLYTVDGTHLSNLGYLKVTSVLDKYINE